MEERKWIEVARASQDDEAELIAGFLHAEGIEAVVENQKFHMEPVNFGDMTRIRILAPEEDSGRARQLIEDRQRHFEQLRAGGDSESILTDEGPVSAPEEPE